MPLRPDRMNVSHRGLLALQQLTQPATAQIARHLPLGAHHDAVADQGPVDRNFSGADAQLPRTVTVSVRLTEPKRQML